MRAAALVAAAILLAGILVAYHPFSSGSSKPARSSTVPGFNVPTTP